MYRFLRGGYDAAQSSGTRRARDAGKGSDMEQTKGTGAIAKDVLAELLTEDGEEIVIQWARDLKTGGYAKYAARPLDELEATCRQCFEGYAAVLLSADYSKIRRFLTREVRARVAQGFDASEMARQLCAFEVVAWPLIADRLRDDPTALVDALGRVRHCVDQAVFEFSDLYQRAAQQQVEEYLAEMEAMNRRLEELSVRDPLTGLYNRRYFHDRLAHEFGRARRHGRPLAMIMVDIDHFKDVNDTYGHQAGDQVLRGIALLLVNQTRTTDITARYGGEEFTAVLPETDAEGAMRVAEKLREKIALTPLHRVEPDQPNAVPSAEPIHCTVSLGVAVYDPERMKETVNLIGASDAALYEAKRRGRNRVIGAWTLPDGGLSSVPDEVAPTPLTANNGRLHRSAS